MAATGAYTDGTYLQANPLWHVEESPWKAEQVLRALHRNRLTPRVIGEVGCGAGEILIQLHDRMDQECLFIGYEISPQAFELCQSRARERITFRLADILQEKAEHFDLILVMDVIEHLEDYFGFLRGIRDRADYKIFHFPLDLSVQTIVRPDGLMRVRRMYRHLHYFTKDMALAILEETGYELKDWFYTARAIDMPSDVLSRRLLRLPRRAAFAIHHDLTVRLLGGYSLLVVAS